MKTDISHCFCEAPWLLNQDGVDNEVDGRAFAVLPGDITNVIAMPVGMKLPFAGDVHKDNKCYKRFELPACLCDHLEDNITSDSIQLRMYDVDNKFKGMTSVNVKQNINNLATEQSEEDQFSVSKAFLNTYIDHINNSFSSILVL